MSRFVLAMVFALGTSFSAHAQTTITVGVPDVSSTINQALDLAGNVACPEPGDVSAGGPITFEDWSGPLSHYMLSTISDPPVDVVWESQAWGGLDVDAKFRKCVQAVRITSTLYDMTE